ncbi:MAG TPA: methyl-accepting chemotaxis protein [Bacillota bacterium]|nr:methyl-accepting chemotaxis protein [Bacillota bacterium]
MLSKLSLRARLFLNFLGVSLIILALAIPTNYVFSARQLEQTVGDTIARSTGEIADKIDRNLFERYGDAQAFSFNKFPDAAHLKVNTDFMNNMMGYYAPIYQLMIMTDATGKVVAVNTVDKGGKALQSSYLLGKNFSETDWFKKAISGEIKPGQTLVEDPLLDEDVRQIYPESSGIAMNFTSPILDAGGKIVGVWTNRMDVSNIEQIVSDSLKKERDRGLTLSGVSLLTPGGQLLYPGQKSGITDAILQGAAPQLKNQQEGYLKEGDSIFGVTHSKGFSTYPARNWAVVFAVDYAQAMKSLDTLVYANLGLFVVAMTLAFALTIFATKTIVAPINSLVYVAQQVSAGDLSQQLPEAILRSDPKLGGAFNEMLTRLRALVREVQQAAGEVASSSTQLSEIATQTTLANEQISLAIGDVTKGNTEQVAQVDQAVNRVKELDSMMESISSGAARQTAEIEEASEIIEEMARNITEVQQNGQGILDSAGQSLVVAAQGAEAVRDTVLGMERIRDTVYGAAEMIRTLDHQSRQVGEIIQLIENIAAETNLLALNAALEAARAGDQGKGFAVVAQQVKALAEGSDKAAKQITTLIEEIRQGISSAVDAMETGTREVGAGVQLSEKAGEALEEILGNIRDTERQARNISEHTARVAQQSSATVQVMGGLGEIAAANITAAGQVSSETKGATALMVAVADIADQNAASAEEVSASTEELNASFQQVVAAAGQLQEMSRILQQETSRFSV